MVKTKHQKSSKPKKQPHIKKHGKQADISEFRAQLDALGLKIIVVTADGNCFFRAIADQLEGNEDEHMKYRSMVVQFIMKHREMFEPFIEDDVPFDEYCQSMEKDGTWAGNMELQAASLVTHSNICIHLKMSPRWYIQNFENHESRMIHLSFHDSEQHYNSVRLKEDTCSGPARPIIIKADADLSGKSYQEKAAVIKAKSGAGKAINQEESIKLAMIGSGCQNEEKIEEVLLQVGGNIEAAIEFFISEQETEEYKIEDDNFTGSVDTSHGCSSDNQNKKGEQCIEKVEDCTLKQQSCSQIEKAGYDNRFQHVEKQNIPRNKMCPCGSKKKYKSCCGTVAARSSARFSVSQTVDYGKSRKDKKQGKKGASSNIANSHASDRGPPDLGALCI